MACDQDDIDIEIDGAATKLTPRHVVTRDVATCERPRMSSLRPVVDKWDNTAEMLTTVTSEDSGCHSASEAASITSTALSGQELGITEQLSSLKISEDFDSHRVEYPTQISQMRQEGVRLWKPNKDRHVNPLDREGVEWQKAVFAAYQHPDILFTQDEDGDSLLHLALIHGKINCVLILLRIIPSRDVLGISNSLRQTVLHLAVLKNYPKVARLLLMHGACADARDWNGNTSLHLACRDGHLECVKMLTTEDEELPGVPQDLSLMNYDGQTCLHLAANHGHLDLVTYFLDEPLCCDVNVPDGKSGRTILHNAVEARQMSLLLFLLQHRSRLGLFLDAQTYCQNTAHSLALGRGFFDIAEFLVLADATPLVCHDEEFERPSFTYVHEEVESSDNDEIDDLYIRGRPVKSLR